MSKAMSAKPGDVLTKVAIRVVFDPYFERVIIGSQIPPDARTGLLRNPSDRAQIAEGSPARTPEAARTSGFAKRSRKRERPDRTRQMVEGNRCPRR